MILKENLLNDNIYSLLTSYFIHTLYCLCTNLDVLFGNKSPASVDPLKQRELARQQLLQTIPVPATLAFGPGLPAAVLTAFEVIQCPQLNKQVIFTLCKYV